MLKFLLYKKSMFTAMACLFISQIVKQMIDYLSLETITITNIDTIHNNNNAPFLSFIFRDNLDLLFYHRYLQKNNMSTVFNVYGDITIFNQFEIPRNREEHYHDIFDKLQV